MKQNSDSHKYDDILHLPHHVSSVHPQMSLQNRAAQFSPFAALSGYDEQAREAARLTDTKIELSESMKALLDEKLRIIQEQLRAGAETSPPFISITFFQPDAHKEGGKYVTFSGAVKKLDLTERKVIFYPSSSSPGGKKTMTGLIIALDDILEITIL